MKRLLNSLLIITLLVSIYSCGSVALTGRQQLLLYSDSQILSLSEQSYTEFMTTATESSNTTANKMVKGVCSKMVTAMENYFKKTGQSSYMSGLSWQCELVKSDEVNAFCMPSGKIVVYEGMLKYASTPDEIAVVVGHEMAHAIAKHSNERMSQQSLVNTVNTALEKIASEKVGNSTLAVFDAALGLGSQYGVLLPFSRKQEYEADRIGLIIMAIAGYNIDTAPTFWEKMSSGSGTSVPEFLSTHPSDANRIKNLKNHLEEARSYSGK